MKIEFYIDESGNTGDIFGIDFYKKLLNQPYFVSVAIGINGEKKIELESKIKEIFSKYTKVNKEIKCKDFYKKRPELIMECVEFIQNNNIPFFVDTVDKKYSINTTMCNHYLSNHCSPKVFNKNKHQMVSDFLTKNMDEKYYQDFYNFLLDPSESNLIDLFNFFNDAMNRNVKGLLNKQSLKIYLEENRSIYLKLRDECGEKALNWFTPIPDYTKNQNKILLLPNIPTLAHLIARVNNFYDLKNVDFIHDIQNDFNHIYSELLTSLTDDSKANLDVGETPYAEFFTNLPANLTYINSEESVFIQLADIVSGFFFRYYTSLFSNPVEIEKIHDDIFCKFWSLSLARTGFGIHMTMGISSRNLIENRFNTCKNK